MYLPDYNGGSIVNLMSSVGRARGRRSDYKELRLLRADEIKGAKNIILINVDGLGYDWLKKNAPNSALARFCRGSITSTFPSTTAAATTCFVTGVPAQQHGMTGWFEYIKELGAVILPLPFVCRSTGESLSGITMPGEIFALKAFTASLRTPAFVFMPAGIAFSATTRTQSRGAKVVPYKTLSALARGIINTSRKAGRKYVYAYIPTFDHSSHVFGATHRQTMREFHFINATFVKLLKSVSPDTVIIVSADHGELDIPRRACLKLSDHPALARTLAAPLCAEPRLVFCYVKPACAKNFEHYVRTRLRQCCTLVKSGDAIKRHWFGLGKAHPNLHDRVGDYILVMKEDFVLRDTLVGEERHCNKADHGGTSRQEMLVPLIVAKK